MRQYEDLFSKGKQANNIAIPVYVRVAHVFKPELRVYFEMLGQGMPKCRAFKAAFKITSQTPLLLETLEFVRREERKDVSFTALFNSLPEIRKYSNTGKPITNVDLNNEFYTWWGAKRLKSSMELHVASIRFMQFTSRLLWDEEFQKQVATFV